MSARPGLAKRALRGHAAIGLLASALIYIICLSGTLAVIAERWQRWEQPNLPEYQQIAPAAVQNAMVRTLALEQGKPKTTHLYVRLPDGDLPRAVVTTDNGAWYVDAGGRPVAREAHGWTEFLLALHVNLTLPVVWGMLLVGALGVVLSALTVTGVLALPKIFRDAFRLRARHDPQLARADWHNRLGVWTLPFALAIALTGAFIGLSYAGAGLLAFTDKGSDVEAVYARIFGDEPARDLAPAPLADAARALTGVEAGFPRTTPTYVIVHDPATRGQFVQVLAEHPRRLIYGESYSFDGEGNYLGKTGLSDGEIGRQAAASTYKLHFGNYAGLPVELAYIVFGLALCAITATGTTLWLRKRQRRGHDSARLAAGWAMVVWGTPLALVLAAWLRAIGGTDAPLAAFFWIALATSVGAAAIRPAMFAPTRLMLCLSLGLTGTSLAHMAYFRNFETGIVAIDLALLAGAGVLGWLAMPSAANSATARPFRKPELLERS